MVAAAVGPALLSIKQGARILSSPHFEHHVVDYQREGGSRSAQRRPEEQWRSCSQMRAAAHYVVSHISRHEEAV